ncbi:hypothetical protein NQD34_010060 [Periophthalmus magnuspinnatus]|nr:hypothetical protein NQD34_010060 [Periophthalmus magnuspinnatus]
MCGSNAIVSSDGNTTKSPVSRRYVLGGHLAQGDVSLTILNVTREDAGTYGCRVDIPGWNNDLKHHFNLEIRQGPSSVSPLNSTSSASDHTTVSPHMTQTSDHVTLPDHVTLSDHVTLEVPVWTSSGARAEETRTSTVLLLSLLLPLLFITTATILIIIVRKRHLLQKMSENLSVVHFSSTASTLHLEQRNQPEENIYN